MVAVIGELLEIVLGLPKTLIFNFRQLPFGQALRLPVFVSHRVALRRVSGRVTVPEGARPGLVRIGFGRIDVFDRRKSRSVWDNHGTVHFRGEALIGHGSKVSNRGEIEFGPRFAVTAESIFLCRERLTFGTSVLISWQVMVMDTDYHATRRPDGSVNADRPISVGDGVWIGARCTVLKGVTIAPRVIVAAGTTVFADLTEPECVYGGSPPKVVARGVAWDRSHGDWNYDNLAAELPAA